MQLFYGSQSCSDHCLPDGLSYGFLWWQVEEVGTWGRNSSPWLRAISLASIALILVSFEMELLLEDFDFLLAASFSLRFTDIDRGRLLLVSPAALEDLEVVVAAPRLKFAVWHWEFASTITKLRSWKKKQIYIIWERQ